MNAIQLLTPGGTEQLQQVTLPTPRPGAGEVLIEVKAISINPVDIKTRNGKALYNSLKEQGPVLLGWDVSGVITELGEGVTDYRTGDEVFGMVNFPGHGQAYAQCVVAPAAHLARKPVNLSHEEAAASTLALLTAWQVLRQVARVEAGERVLMQAAAGGVGHFGVQVARHLGATVVATGSARSEAFCRELGADAFVDYTKGTYEDQTEEVDMVFDAVGGEGPLRCLPVLRPGGRMVCIAGGLTDEVKTLAAEKGCTVSSYLVQSSGIDMQDLADLLAQGRIRPHLMRVYPFSAMADAHQQLETGHTRGKIVLTMEQ